MGVTVFLDKNRWNSTAAFFFTIGISVFLACCVGRVCYKGAGVVCMVQWHGMEKKLGPIPAFRLLASGAHMGGFK